MTARGLAVYWPVIALVTSTVEVAPRFRRPPRNPCRGGRLTETGQKGDTVDIRIIGFPAEIERHRGALNALRVALGDHQFGGPMPVDPEFPGAGQGVAVQYVILTEG